MQELIEVIKKQGDLVNTLYSKRYPGQKLEAISMANQILLKLTELRDKPKPGLLRRMFRNAN